MRSAWISNRLYDSYLFSLLTVSSKEALVRHCRQAVRVSVLRIPSKRWEEIVNEQLELELEPPEEAEHPNRGIVELVAQHVRIIVDIYIFPHFTKFYNAHGVTLKRARQDTFLSLAIHKVTHLSWLTEDRIQILAAKYLCKPDDEMDPTPEERQCIAAWTQQFLNRNMATKVQKTILAKR